MERDPKAMVGFSKQSRAASLFGLERSRSSDKKVALSGPSLDDGLQNKKSKQQNQNEQSNQTNSISICSSISSSRIPNGSICRLVLHPLQVNNTTHTHNNMNDLNTVYEDLIQDLLYFTETKQYKRAIETIDELKEVNSQLQVIDQPF